MAQRTINSEIHGTVWKIEASVGDQLDEDDTIVVLESMKMEIPVEAPVSGTVIEILVADGDLVTEGQPLAKIAT